MAFPCSANGGTPPVSYWTAQRKVRPPRAQDPLYGRSVGKNTTPAVVARGSVMTRSAKYLCAPVLSKAMGAVPVSRLINQPGPVIAVELAVLRSVREAVPT